ncbi:MAG: hypothetical protein ACR2N9_09600 [Acidimicrobiia bacterium]
MADPVKFLAIAALAAAVGGWAIPIGAAIDLSGWSTYLAACTGSVMATVLLLGAGDRLRALAVSRMSHDEEPSPRQAWVRRLVDRWGVPGLAIASVVVGPTITIGLAFVLNVDRLRFGIWLSATTLVFFFGLTVFWFALL